MQTLPDPSRRRFLGGLTAGLLVTPITRLTAETKPSPVPGFRSEAEGLLRDWCDGLLKQQVPEGAFHCPACRRIHGRCGDALLPLLSMAALDGGTRYRDAAVRLLGWMKNVDSPDGAWTNETDPASWKGTTVFTAIALAEALEWHGVLMEEKTRAALLTRLQKAGQFIQTHFTTQYGNINYAAAGAYGLSLLGRLLDEPAFTRKGRELAHQTLAFFTKKDHLLFGEGHPTDLRSKKGCVPVDLGYNVTESLPSLVHYAILEGDREVLDAAVSSFKTHLEFMLPDGGWDNSWGTRSYKWTYWGSRTTDGCQSAFMHLAATDPVFATAAWRNLRLLRSCTHDGLLHGGPHYAGHAVPACVHHTFVQAKSIAGALHQANLPERLDSLPSLPRARASGIRHFPDVDVHLASFGPWRATLSGYDWFYRPGLYQATGGTIGMLWHERLGPLLTAGLATYMPVEAGNMQPIPNGVDFPLACRIEIRTPDGKWFTNLHDGGAVIRHESNKDSLRMIVECRLLSAQANDPDSGPCRFRIEHAFHRDSFTMTATPLDPTPAEWSLVVPVISTQDERITEHSDSSWEIIKSQGPLTISSKSPITRVPSQKARVFNLIPGFQAVPFRLSSSGPAPVEFNLTSLA